MWSDSEDFAILADMYQIRIKVITTKGVMDERPTVNWIYPDKKMAEFAELKNVELEDMVLLHENDSHFNLIVSGESDLATLGSLSYRFNMGPMLKDTNEEKEEKEEKEESVDSETELVEEPIDNNVK